MRPAVRAELLTALVCAVDGAVVAALVGDGEGPRATARATLVDVIDVLASFQAEDRSGFWCALDWCGAVDAICTHTSRAVICSA